MQNAASTASAAKYPNTSIPDIEVEPLCASVISAQMLPLDLAIGCDGHHKNVDSQFSVNYFTFRSYLLFFERRLDGVDDPLATSSRRPRDDRRGRAAGSPGSGD
jgi:hypothetical protein